ncbi:MFS transporter, partial [Nocardiopsis flavescens]
MRDVTRYLGGATAARTGDEMSGPALLLLGMALTGEAVAGSALLAGLTGAAAVGGPLVGALLDRSARPGRLLAWALCAYAAGLVALALAVGRVPLPLAVGAAAAVGLLGPALSGGWTAQLPRAVPSAPCGRVDAWDAMT